MQSLVGPCIICLYMSLGIERDTGTSTLVSGFPMRHQPIRPRVVVANEPRSYREVMTETLSEIRPEIDFLLVDPAELARAVPGLLPDMVICDEATAVVQDNAPIWLELYPKQNPSSVLGFQNEVSTVENIQFSDILAIVDRAVEHTT